MKPDTVSWGGKRVGDLPPWKQRTLGDGRFAAHDHKHGREISISTCTIADTYSCPADAWDTAQAGESVAETFTEFTRLSRLDLAEDTEILARDLIQGAALTALEKGLACWVYWSGKRRGLTLFPDGLDRLRIYDKGIESNVRDAGIVWRVEAQLRRGQLGSVSSVVDAPRLVRSVRETSRAALDVVGLGGILLRDSKRWRRS